MTVVLKYATCRWCGMKIERLAAGSSHPLMGRVWVHSGTNGFRSCVSGGKVRKAASG